MSEKYTEPKTQREAVLDMHRDMKDVKQEIYGNGTGRGIIRRLDDVENKLSGNGDKKGKWIIRLTLITLAVTMATEKIPDILKWLRNLFP